MSLPVNPRVPFIVVKRHWLDEFASGRKTVEYRRYGRMFTERTFYPGRAIRIGCSYNPAIGPVLTGRVVRFEVNRAGDLNLDFSSVYPDLDPADRIASIHLDLDVAPATDRRGPRLLKMRGIASGNA